MNAEHRNSIEEAKRAGFDLSLIDSNLRLTPKQRLLRHDAALGRGCYCEKPARPSVQNNLHLLLERLADAGLDFVVIGGYAGVLHGSSLVTKTYRVISIEDLIAAKEAVGREKDLLAAKELRCIVARRSGPN